MSKPKPSSPEAVAARITAAENEFRALLQRHRVEFAVEQGESSMAGKFLRIVFVPREALAPKPGAK